MPHQKAWPETMTVSYEMLAGAMPALELLCLPKQTCVDAWDLCQAACSFLYWFSEIHDMCAEAYYC